MLQHYVLGFFGYLLNTQQASASLLKPLGFWSLLFGPAFFYFASQDSLSERPAPSGGWPPSAERSLYWQDSLDTGAWHMTRMCSCLSRGTEASSEMHNLRKRTMQLAQLAAGIPGLQDDAGRV